MSRSFALALAAALAAAVVIAIPLMSEGVDAFRGGMTDEIRLAASAGPPHVASAATLYRRTSRGYEIARTGTNGFACLVEQSHPSSSEPICYDREGVATHLPVTLARGAWRAEGVDSAEIARRIAEGYEQGTFRAPRHAGIAYMLSPETRFWNPSTRAVEPGTPHLMFYAPYLTNADIGSRGEHHAGVGVPFVIEEGSPRAYIVVLVPAATPVNPR
jgi:hypothetical protein